MPANLTEHRTEWRAALYDITCYASFITFIWDNCSTNNDPITRSYILDRLLDRRERMLQDEKIDATGANLSADTKYLGQRISRKMHGLLKSGFIVEHIDRQGRVSFTLSAAAQEFKTLPEAKILTALLAEFCREEQEYGVAYDKRRRRKNFAGRKSPRAPEKIAVDVNYAEVAHMARNISAVQDALRASGYTTDQANIILAEIILTQRARGQTPNKSDTYEIEAASHAPAPAQKEISADYVSATLISRLCPAIREAIEHLLDLAAENADLVLSTRNLTRGLRRLTTFTNSIRYGLQSAHEIAGDSCDAPVSEDTHAEILALLEMAEEAVANTDADKLIRVTDSDPCSIELPLLYGKQGDKMPVKFREPPGRIKWHYIGRSAPREERAT